jgi:hypothetical protein
MSERYDDPRAQPPWNTGTNTPAVEREPDQEVLLEYTECHNREWCTCPSCKELRARERREGGQGVIIDQLYQETIDSEKRFRDKVVELRAQLSAERGANANLVADLAAERHGAAETRRQRDALNVQVNTFLAEECKPVDLERRLSDARDAAVRECYGSVCRHLDHRGSECVDMIINDIKTAFPSAFTESAAPEPIPGPGSLETAMEHATPVVERAKEDKG